MATCFVFQCGKCLSESRQGYNERPDGWLLLWFDGRTAGKMKRYELCDKCVEAVLHFLMPVVRP